MHFLVVCLLSLARSSGIFDNYDTYVDEIDAMDTQEVYRNTVDSSTLFLNKFKLEDALKVTIGVDRILRDPAKYSFQNILTIASFVNNISGELYPTGSRKDDYLSKKLESQNAQISKIKPADRTEEIKEMVREMSLEKLYAYTVRILTEESDLKSLYIACIGLDKLAFEESKNLNRTDFKILLKRVEKVYSSIPEGTRSEGDYKAIVRKLDYVIKQIKELLSVTGKLRPVSDIKFGQILYEYENKDIPSENPKMFEVILHVIPNYNYTEILDYPVQKEKIKKWLKPMEEYYFNQIVEIKDFDDQVQLEQAIRQAIPNLRDSRKLQMYMFIKWNVSDLRASAIALLLLVENSTQTGQELFRSYCGDMASLLQQQLVDDDPLKAQLNEKISKKFPKSNISISIAPNYRAVENTNDFFLASVLKMDNPYSALYQELSKPEYDYLTIGIKEIRDYLISNLGITN
jgi:hypothetical protein